jgi:3D (Asp-Asp-Asp) domain-containing protein
MIFNEYKIFLLLFLFTVTSCIEKEEWCTIEVIATAYNSTKAQTDGDPNITAWGDTLKLNTKSIAVSNDLIKLGLTHHTKVKIEGFEGIYIVNDRMHSKWKKRIDIYFGNDVKAARQWGRKKVTIQYLLE